MNWRTVDLSEVVNIKTGKLDSNAAVTGGRYPFFTCSQETFWINTFSFDAECVLLAGNNANGIFPLKYFHGKFDAYQRTYVLTTRHPDLLIPRFLYYALRPRLSELRGIATGAAAKFLTLPIIHRTKIQVPSLPTQHRIVSILSAYDDLIEVNRRRVAILEEMARRLFEEWFVHLRFPGHETIAVNDTPDGYLPKGWKIGNVNDLIDIDPPTALPRNGSRPFIPMASLDTRTSIIDGIERRKSGSGAKFRNGDTLFARITPCLENGKTGLVRDLPDDGVGFGSTEFIVMRRRVAGPSFTYLLARHASFRRHAQRSMSGATGRQRARTESIRTFELPVPPIGHLNSFELAAWPMLELVGRLGSANMALSAARDLLLPRLVSGELSVANAPAPDRLLDAAD